MTDIVPVLLAGGLGTRLWPLSREVYPKQLMNLSGEGSLLQQAAERALSCAPASKIITITTETHYLPVRDQLAELDEGLTENILLEPMGRNTAAAIAISARHATTLADDPTLFVAPADHVVRNSWVVVDAVQLAATARGHITTFGITPDRPETGYGYIRVGEPLKSPNGMYAAARFIEKPNAARAADLIAEGGVLWNSGMFVFSASLLADELAIHAPEIAQATETAYEQRRTTAGALRFAKDAYEAIPAQPIDIAVMERSTNVAVIPIDPGWSDVGSWQKLWEVGEHDGDGNASTGDVRLAEAHNNVVHASSRLVAVAGIDNLAVVETADAVLVSALSNDGAIKTLVESLRTDGREEAVRHLMENRPWGSFQVLLGGDRFKIKEIIVKPGARLSLQSHKHRSEHWVVLEGIARVTTDDTTRDVPPNHSAYIEVGARHRLENPGTTPVRIVEVQVGDYVGEDDIERYDDEYGRAEA
jgi:mannose-1-phosphate guanylyltransferase/mannose-6-phosphate isomerase